MHPYFQAIIDAHRASGRPFFHQVSPVEARAMLRAAASPPSNLPELATIGDLVIEAPQGPIRARRYTPNGEISGMCIYFHAGGWVIGDLDQADNTCRRLAHAASAELVSVDYRLAPEHPFPAALDDAFAAVCWAQAHAQGPVLTVGESAGANLAAACAIRARDAGAPAIAGQFLSCPVTDHDFETPSYQEIGPRNWLLSTNDMRWFWDQYCPAPMDRTLALVSPLRVANAEGLAPALIHVADLDPLRDEGLAYAKKLADAGVAVSVRQDAGMLHGYLNAAGAIQQAAEALAEAGAWVKARLKEADG